MKDTGVNTTVCRFSLYPMSDDYIEIILGSLDKTDTSAVFSKTDAVSTIYAGDSVSVSDAVRALFVNAYRPGVHMAIEGELGAELPDDVPIEAVFSLQEERPNGPLTEQIRFPVRGRYELFSAEPEGLALSSGELHGDVHRIFDFLERVYESAEPKTDGQHPVLRFTVNCNSPTEEEP